MISSHSLIFDDFKSAWYKRWARELKQDKRHLDGYALYANKFWQNAVIAQALFERDVLKKGKRGLGFGVGQERLPALLAAHGVEVTATDQDFRTVKAGHWAAQELATSSQSLNKLKICKPEQFRELVEYMSVDMSNIPQSLDSKYDFLWSNCALGHLGSIPAGLDFITRSLDCLQPGGWAVHTTELNILSNKETVTEGSTVVFRLRDIYKLQLRLAKAGYSMKPFRLELGELPEDKRISMRPQFGNDNSKIQIMGHLGTQIVLIIHKPERLLTTSQRLSTLLSVQQMYRRNRDAMAAYRRTDASVKLILGSQRVGSDRLVVTPEHSKASIRIRKGETGTIRLVYTNESPYPLFSMSNRLADSKPIVLATTDPKDRMSVFRDKSWAGRNRVTSSMYVKEGRKWVQANYIQPGQTFSVLLPLRASTQQRPDTYQEHFSLVQELSGWLDSSTVAVTVEVV